MPHSPGRGRVAREGVGGSSIPPALHGIIAPPVPLAEALDVGAARHRGCLDAAPLPQIHRVAGKPGRLRWSSRPEVAPPPEPPVLACALVICR
jgi:hypothetical protein